MTRVLICDDVEDARFLLRMQLGLEGDLELVGEADNGVEAVRMAREFHPDVVLLDLAMPAMDGFETLGQIVSASPGSKVVVFSALSAETTARRALDQGASAYVQKGAPANEIIGVIRRVTTGSAGTEGSEIVSVDIPLEPPDLVEAKERFARIFEDSPIGIALGHVNGHLARVNKAFTEMVGRSEEELVGMSFRDITHPDDLATQTNRMQSIPRGNSSVARLEKRYIRGDGSLAWGVLSISLVRDPKGEPLYFIGQILDISERKRLDAEKDRFIARAAHEIRTPLAALSGYTTLLSGTTELSERQINEFVQATERQSRRINNLLDNLLDLSLSDKEGRLAASGPVDLREIAIEVVASLSPEIAASISAEVPSGFIAVADAVSVERVLVNLIGNAVRYGGGALFVRGGHVGGRVAIEVIDGGPGIKPEIAAVMFEPFERGRDVEGIEGSGLGLAVCRGLARAMGGELTFRPNIPTGAIFTLLLNPV